MRQRPLHQVLPAAAFLAVAAFTPLPALAGSLLCTAVSNVSVEVNGSCSPGAQIYASEGRSIYLVDIISEPDCLIVDVGQKWVVPVSRWDVKPDARDSIRVRTPDRSTRPTGYALSVEGEVLRFQTGTSEVRLVGGDVCRASGAQSLDTSIPLPDNEEARQCLRLQARAEAAGIAGCKRFVYVSNICEDPVVGAISRTEHLFTGTLPQTFTILLQGRESRSLGCSWWSGAMAPTDVELIGAGFPPKPTRTVHGQHHRPTGQ